MAYFKCSGALFNGTIIINTIAGATVTATTASTTRSFQAVANAGGVATIRVKKRGAYNVASTGTTRIGHATVSNQNAVTAVYNWSKYNSDYIYSQVSNSHTIFSYMTLRTLDSSYAGKYLRNLGQGNVMTFNSSNGKYYNSNNGIYYPQISASGSSDSCWGKGVQDFSYCDTFGMGSYGADWYVKNLSTESNMYMSANNWNLIVSTIDGCVFTYYYSTGNWYRGSYIGVVTSTSLNGYPSDSRAGDGYWYVAS